MRSFRRIILQYTIFELVPFVANYIMVQCWPGAVAIACSRGVPLTKDFSAWNTECGGVGGGGGGGGAYHSTNIQTFGLDF